MPSNSTVIDVIYDDPRTGQRIRERRVQEIPFGELENVRNRELALVTRPRDQEISRYDGGGSRYDSDQHTVDRTVSRRTRDRRDDYEDLPPRRSYDQGSAASATYSRRTDSYDRRSSRRREPTTYSDSESSSSQERERRRGNRRPEDERGAPKKKESKARELKEGVEERRTGNFANRNFDYRSFDGLVAGVAGAAIGAIVAQRFAGDEKRTMKTVAGAVVGAAALNSGEKSFRLFVAEDEEEKEEEEAGGGGGGAKARR